MNCPKCGEPIDRRLIAREFASNGGKTTGKTKARDPKKMRAAALKRWANQEETKKQTSGINRSEKGKYENRTNNKRNARF